MNEKDRETKRYSGSDAASLQLASSIAALAARLEEVVSIQQTLAEDLAEHSRKSTAAQAMLLNEIEKAKIDHLMRTGDQSKAIEILRIERESMDNEIRNRLEYYEKKQPKLIQKLETISARLESGSLKIDKGVRAWEILKWAGIVIGGLLLTAAVVKLFLSGGAVNIGASPVRSDAGAVSFVMANVWGAWLGISGLIVAAIDFKMKHFGG